MAITDEILSDYLACLSWVFDLEGYEFSDSAVQDSERDLQEFLSWIPASLFPVLETANVSIGHEFALDRNNEGSGLWDRGLGTTGDQLSEVARSFRPVSLWVEFDVIQLRVV